jgi:hypothetical protein
MGVRFEPEPEVRRPSDCFATAFMRRIKHQPVAMMATRTITTPTIMPARAPVERPDDERGVEATLGTAVSVGVILLTAAVATGLACSVGAVEGTYAVLMMLVIVWGCFFESVVVVTTVKLTVGNVVS